MKKREVFKLINIPLKLLKANPWRHIENYPINEEKVEALIQSYKKTGVWPNIEARPAKHGISFEIAYGHHRLEAARRHFGEEHKIPVVVWDMDAATMIQKMASENDDVYGSDASVVQETIKAVVEAFAKSQITLESPETKFNKVMVAPNYKEVDAEAFRTSKKRFFSALTVARFLGWTEGKKDKAQQKVYGAIRALRLIEEGAAEHETFEGLGTKKAAMIVKEVEKTKRQTKKLEGADDGLVNEAARKTVQVATKIAHAGGSELDIERAAAEVRMKAAKKTKDKPDITEYVNKLARRFGKSLKRDTDAVYEVIVNAEYASSHSLRELTRTVRGVAGILIEMSQLLDKEIELKEEIDVTPAANRNLIRGGVKTA